VVLQGNIMSTLLVSMVFTPNERPTVTYVERSGHVNEKTLAAAVATPKQVISVSGPSKAGKTVMIERAIGADNVIHIYGAGIKNPDNLWDSILNWMGAPSERMLGSTRSTETNDGGKVTSQAGLGPFVKVGAEATFSGKDGKALTESVKEVRSGMHQVVRELKDSSFVVFLDDFHYIDRDRQSEIARSIKAVSEQGVKFCVASVPHRADDLVLNNSELRGRVIGLDLPYWSVDELVQIAEKGFAALGVVVDQTVVLRLANEAAGSPQLMQCLCFDLCTLCDITDAGAAKGKRLAAADVNMAAVLRATSTRTNYSTLVTTMHKGPRIRGEERKEFSLVDGTRGDAYRVILKAISADPPALSFPYKRLMERVAAVCHGEPPTGSSVQNSCTQIAKFAANVEDDRVVDWDEDAGNLDIVSPYFMFYLRASGKLAELGQTAAPQLF